MTAWYRRVFDLAWAKRLAGWQKPWFKRAVLGAGGAFIALAGVSYTRALLAPNSPGWDLRTAEWARDNHLGWSLDLAEWAYFSLHRPSAEEQEVNQLSRFPQPFRRKGADVPRPGTPPPIAVVFDKPLPGEGEWDEIGSTVNGVPVLRTTYFRPDTTCPEASVAVARFTPGMSRFVLVPGTRDPPGGDWRWRGGIPQDQHTDLLAAFNAGFRLRDAQGGLYAEGQVAQALVEGAASLVIDRNGAMDVVAWDGKRALTPEVAAVRQNLRLIVNQGKSRVRRIRCNKGLARSGLGVARDGALIYVTGHGLDVGLLAKALEHTGAERAMQLDMHAQWQSFNVFQPDASQGPPALVATKLTKTMRLPAVRYLTPTIAISSPPSCAEGRWPHSRAGSANDRRAPDDAQVDQAAHGRGGHAGDEPHGQRAAPAGLNRQQQPSPFGHGDRGHQ